MRENGNHGQWVGGYPSADVFLEDIARGCSYLIEASDGTAVGTFAFIPGPDPTYARIYDDYLPSGEHLPGAWINAGPYYVVHRIASRPDCHGIMAALLDYCFEHTSSLRIDTHRDNLIMQHLMERNGFTRCGIIYLANGDERLAYQKVLQDDPRIKPTNIKTKNDNE